MRRSFRRVLEGFSTCEGETNRRQREKERDFNYHQFLLRLGTGFVKKINKKNLKNLMATKTTFGKQLY